MFLQTSTKHIWLLALIFLFVEPTLKKRFRVKLTNTAGAREAGLDGGGLFREFSSELLKSAFDPNRGFFLLTRDNMLYPNPSSPLLHSDFEKHYFFIGRMVGKVSAWFFIFNYYNIMKLSFHMISNETITIRILALHRKELLMYRRFNSLR